MFCRYCGKQIEKDVKFCKYCGKQLQNEEVKKSAKTKLVKEEKIDEVPETKEKEKKVTEIKKEMKPVSSLPTVAMILGILSLVFVISSPVFAIPAIITGILGLKYKKGMSISGIIMGSLSLLLFIFVILFLIAIILDNLDNSVEGKWIYEKTGGSFNFYDNDTYYYYYSDDNLDNYCHGNYNVKDGYTTSTGHIQKNDDNYNYYTVTLESSMCRINGKYDYSENTFSRIFGILKEDKDRAIMKKNANSNYEINLIKEN